MVLTNTGQGFVWKHNIILTHLIREIFHQSDLIQGKNINQKQYLNLRLNENY